MPFLIGGRIHTTVRWFIKTGIGFFFAGLALGVVMLVRREVYGTWPDPYLVSAHNHLVFGGFVMFMILGVALWLFPREAKDGTRYDPRLVRIAYWLLAVGTSVRAAGEVTRALVEIDGVGWVVMGGAGAIVIGFGVYFWTMWNRIRAVGSKIREQRGERF